MGYENKSSIKLCNYKQISLSAETIAQASEDAKLAPQGSVADTRKYLLQTEYVKNIVNASKIKVSSRDAEERAQKMLRAMDQQLANNGIEFDTYFKETNSTQEELLADFKVEAEKQLKSRMALHEIARLEGLLATEDEYGKEVARLSELSMIPEERLRELFKQGEETNIREDIAISKAADYIGRIVEEKYGC